MFRYICPIIIAGGKSSRMGISKAFYPFNNLKFLDKNINLCFDLGFSLVYTSGNFIKNFCIYDKIFSFGPISPYFSILFNKIFTQFSHFLIIPIDMVFIKKKKILHLCLNVFFFLIVTEYFFYHF